MAGQLLVHGYKGSLRCSHADPDQAYQAPSPCFALQVQLGRRAHKVSLPGWPHHRCNETNIWEDSALATFTPEKSCVWQETLARRGLRVPQDKERQVRGH